MGRLKKLKILLLGLAVIIITCTIFLALPAQLPSFSLLSCERVTWGCSQRGEPVKYDTLLWATPEHPDYQAILDARLFVEDTDDILDGLRFSNGMGKLNFAVDPENENRIIVSGYLQYGFYVESENATGIEAPDQVQEWQGQGVLRFQSIQITLLQYYKGNKVEEDFEVYTGANGFFSVEIVFEDVPESYSITADYEGDVIIPSGIKKPVEIYFPTDISYFKYGLGMFEFPEPGTPWWVWLIVGMAVVAAGVLIYRYLKRRSKKPTIKVPEAKEMPTPFVETKITEEPEEKDNVGGDLLRIEIRFPQIKDPLTAVWGEGEAITVLIRLKDRNGNVLPSQPGEVDWGDGETMEAASDKEGRIRLKHTFDIKGEYRISASYLDGDNGKKVSSWRKIRIVDYREEMVRLFNEMVGTLNIRDIHIDREMTAREIEKLLAPRLRGIPGRTIKRIVAGFEEANYSLHPVARKSYQAMYLAISEVLNYGG